jgi:4-amino-4-deoxy-L-arabinose transferase-like glycosyltransferase
VTRLPTLQQPLALVIVAFLVLGTVYSTAIPLFEAPDEQWHFAYVQYIATGGGLPVQSPDHPAHLARQEGSQPPLYYLLATAATFWINTSDFPDIVWENPHYGYDVPGIVNDNKNLFIHTARENFPYQGAALAIHFARLVSLLLGALAIFFTYRLTLEIYPEAKFVGLSAAALVAFVPQFLLVSSAVSNDSAIVAMSAVSLWLIVGLPRSEPSLGRVAATGAATGLAALAKVSGLGLVLVAIVVLILVERKNWRRLAVHLIALVAVFILVAGWWYLRNWVLYGEFTGTDRMLHIFGARQTPLTLSQLLTQLGEVWETFWLGFGWGNIRAQPPVYVLLGILILLCALGLVIGMARRRHQVRDVLAKALPLVVLAIWATMVFVELLRWMMLTRAPHGRLLFPALPALMPLLVVGLTQWTSMRVRPLVAVLAATALFALAALAPFLILAPAYAYPPVLGVDDVRNLKNRVDINYDDKVELIGYDLAPSAAQPGGAIQLDLYWQSLTAMDRDYSIGIHVLDRNQRVIGARDSYPGHGLVPTRLWRVGQIFRDTYWVPIALDATAPSVAQIQIAVYDRSDKSDLTAVGPNGQAITPIVGRFKLATPNPAPVNPENPAHYTFGTVIALAGYDLRSDSGLDLTFYWKRAAPMKVDYTVFVHILDAAGNIVAQKDRQPMDGADPTSLWEEGEQVVDRYSFEAPLDPAAAQIEIGMYRTDTGQRLEVADENGKPLGDHVMLPLHPR